ncbi:hypothetical protein [Shewanella algae]|uniref:hypothetical protein n=1 Tax=Shewanella algae TaxID=38313 RepID=UPI003007812F
MSRGGVRPGAGRPKSEPTKIMRVPVGAEQLVKHLIGVYKKKNFFNHCMRVLAMEIKFIEKDQVWQSETTNYWFEVDGVIWAVSDCNGELKLLDSEGYPVEPCNDKEFVLDALKSHYEQHILD